MSNGCYFQSFYFLILSCFCSFSMCKIEHFCIDRLGYLNFFYMFTFIFLKSTFFCIYFKYLRTKTRLCGTLHPVCIITSRIEQ